MSEQITLTNKPVGFIRSTLIMWLLGVALGVLVANYAMSEAVLYAIGAVALISLYWFARICYRVDRLTQTVGRLMQMAANSKGRKP
jgi:arginine exporter protein ArgO